MKVTKACPWCSRSFIKNNHDAARQALNGHQRKCPNRPPESALQGNRNTSESNMPVGLPAPMPVGKILKKLPLSESDNESAGLESISEATGSVVVSSSVKEEQQDDCFSVFPGGVQRGEIQTAVQFLAAHKNYLQPGFQQEFFFSAQQRVAVGKRFTSVQHDKLLELEAVIRGLVEMDEAEEQERERFMERARHPMALAGYYPHDATCYICIDNAAFSARAQSLIDAEMADAAAWMKAEAERKAKAARIAAERKAHGG